MEGKLRAKKNKNIDKTHKLYGKKIVMSGFRDKNLMQRIADVGGKLGSSVGSSVFVLIVQDPDDSTSKIEKAKEKGVTIMTPEAFVKKFL